MNRSTKSLLRAAVFAPAAAVVAMAGAPAHASTDTGPLAALFNGPLKSLGGQGIAVPKADLAHPTSVLPAGPVRSANGLVTLAKGVADVSRTRGGADQAVATLGQGGALAGDALPTSLARGTALLRSLARGVPVTLPGGQGAQGMLFSGAIAKCVTAANGAVTGLSTIEGGKLLGGTTGGVLGDLPVHPPANYLVPTGNPDFRVTLNKQVRDPKGGTTVSAINLEDTTGTLQNRALGVVHCVPLAGPLAGPQAAQRRQDVSSPVTDLLGQVTPQVQALLGGLTGAPTAVPPAGLPSLPVDPAGTVGVVKDALPAGLGDTQVPAVPARPLSSVSRVFGGLPGLPMGHLPATSLAGKLPVG